MKPSPSLRRASVTPLSRRARPVDTPASETPYDWSVALAYDSHFRRRVDRWEDERLASMLAPIVNGKAIIDLGCGTGWVLDHLRPTRDAYLGLDASDAMLNVLEAKHADAETRQVWVNRDHWLDGLPIENDAIVATWAAHDFGNLSLLLPDLNRILRPGGIVALHGQSPRYLRRRHYVLGERDPNLGFLHWTERACRLARTGTTYDPPLIYRGAYGTGATDCGLSRRWWLRTGRVAPPTQHFAFLALWEKAA